MAYYNSIQRAILHVKFSIYWVTRDKSMQLLNVNLKSKKIICNFMISFQIKKFKYLYFGRL